MAMAMRETLEEYTIQPLPTINSKQKKVLLIDDTELFIELERSVLEKLTGVEILTASNGRDALQLIESEHPDLIFLDFHMEGMNGDECCRQIKEKCSSSNMPVVMVTAGGDEEDYRACWEAGCDAIILKPIHHSLLIATTLKYLRMTRTSPRHKVANLKICYGTDMQTNLSDYCINLSMGGLFLSTKNILPVDTQLAIEFVLPNRDLPIVCHASVVWTNGPMGNARQHLPAGMGLRFIDLTLEDLHAIRDYLSVGRLKPVW